jgi:protease-4
VDEAVTAPEAGVEVEVREGGESGVCGEGRETQRLGVRRGRPPRPTTPAPFLPQYPPPAPAYVKPTPGAAAATKFRLAFALPWRRFKRDSVLVVPLAGSIGDKRGGRFSSAATLPQITRALEKAAYDPRVAAVYLKIDPLAAGWAKLGEIRDYVKLFKASGKVRE